MKQYNLSSSEQSYFQKFTRARLKNSVSGLALVAIVSCQLAGIALAAPQTIYSATPAPADNYVPLPQIVSGNSNTSTGYSASEYPTAQGNFLKLPPGYRPTTPSQAPVATVAYAPKPSVVAAANAPTPYPSSNYAAVTAPATGSYVAPQATAASGGPVITSTPLPQIYSSPSSAAATMPSAGAPVIYSAQPAKSVPAAQPVTPTVFSNMNSYSYDRNLDPSKPTYKTPIAKDPKLDKSDLSLATLSQFELGLAISGYRYQEFGPDGSEFIRITGPTVSVLMDYSWTFSHGWFITADLSGSYGSHKYTGGDVNLMTGVTTPSTKSGVPDFTVDTRSLVGHDFLISDAFWGATDIDLTPYTGAGFRLLYEDGSGTDSQGVEGYDRYSHYLYIPFGVTPRIRLSDRSRLDINFEYDVLAYGFQDSELPEGDLTDSQSSGYGIRGSVMYERPDFKIGPYFEFWDIGQSSTDCINGLCGFEPHNQTLEAGLKGLWKF